MKLKIFISTFVFAAVALIAFSRTNRQAFAPAEAFPRGALVYAQINNLPEFVKLWNESKFKEKYLTSENFRDFKNRHLGRKLASRWAEFNEASGFSLDLETVAGLAESRGAIALYDIGKLEFVFIAPLSNEIFTATKFVQNQHKFEQKTFADGTIIYRAAVEADRGRQKQELIFANVKERFILTTSEKLLMQTLNNIENKQAKNRLSDEPAFAALSKKIEPHLATVWVNQKVLNDDYYFKRYWLMSKRENLKNLRAGIFDFEMQEGKLIERRRFLLNQIVKVPPVEAARAAEMLSLMPENIPFYRLRTANPETIDEAVKSTIFERRKPEKKQKTDGGLYFSSSDNYYDYFGGYDSLGEQFDEAITDVVEDEAIERRATEVDFSHLLQPANPKAILSYTALRLLPAPMFTQFDRVAIFSLTSPAEFNSAAFEAAIARKLSGQTTISSPDPQLQWESKTGNDLHWRELRVPMLEIEVCYILRDRKLILTNNAEFWRNIPFRQNPTKVPYLTAPMTGLTVVSLNQRENAYDLLFAELTKNKVAADFFTGNVASLLDSISEVEKIEIIENYSNDIFEEEVVVNFK